MITILRSVAFLFAISVVSAQTLSAILDWDPSLSSDVAGYHVYRRTSSESNYQRLTTDLITSGSYSDSTVVYGELYSYAATAVSSTGEESAFSNQVTLDLICRGDVNTDMQRNVLDVVQIQNHIVGNLLLQNNAVTAGDVDGDELVSVLDAVKLLNHVVGNLTLPDCIM